MKESDMKLLAVMIFEQIYSDIRNIVREEIERALNNRHESEDVNE